MMMMMMMKSCSRRRHSLLVWLTLLAVIIVTVASTNNNDVEEDSSFVSNTLRFAESMQPKVTNNNATQARVLTSLKRKTRVRMNRLELAIALGANHVTGTRHALKQLIVRWVSIAMIQAKARVNDAVTKAQQQQSPSNNRARMRRKLRVAKKLAQGKRVRRRRRTRKRRSRRRRRRRRRGSRKSWMDELPPDAKKKMKALAKLHKKKKQEKKKARARRRSRRGRRTGSWMDELPPGAKQKAKAKAEVAKKLKDEKKKKKKDRKKGRKKGKKSRRRKRRGTWQDEMPPLSFVEVSSTKGRTSRRRRRRKQPSRRAASKAPPPRKVPKKEMMNRAKQAKLAKIAHLFRRAANANSKNTPPTTAQKRQQQVRRRRRRNRVSTNSSPTTTTATTKKKKTTKKQKLLWRTFLVNMFRLDDPNFMCGSGLKHRALGCFLCTKCSISERVDRLHRVLSHGNLRELWHAAQRLTASDEGMDMNPPTPGTNKWTYNGGAKRLRPGSVRDLVAWYWTHRTSIKYRTAIRALHKWGLNHAAVKQRMAMVNSGRGGRPGLLTPQLATRKAAASKTTKLGGKSKSVLAAWHRASTNTRARLTLGKKKFNALGGRAWAKQKKTSLLELHNTQAKPPKSKKATTVKFSGENLRKYQLHSLSPFESAVLKEHGYKSNSASLPWGLKPLNKKATKSASTMVKRATLMPKIKGKVRARGTVLDVTSGLGAQVARVIGVGDMVGMLSDSYLRHYLMLSCVANTLPYFDYSLNSVMKAVAAGAHKASMVTGGTGAAQRNPTAVFDTLTKEPSPAKSLQVRLSWPQQGSATSSVVPLVSYPPARARVTLRSTYAYFFTHLARNHRNWPTWGKSRPIIMRKKWLKTQVNEAKLRVARDEYVCLNTKFGKMVQRMMCKWPLRITKRPSRVPAVKKPPVAGKKLAAHMMAWQKRMRQELKMMASGMDAKYRDTVARMNTQMKRMRGKMTAMQKQQHHQSYVNHLRTQIHSVTYITLSTIAHMMTAMDNNIKHLSRRHRHRHRRRRRTLAPPTVPKTALPPIKVKVMHVRDTQPKAKAVKAMIAKLDKLANDEKAPLARRTMAHILVAKLTATTLQTPANKMRAQMHLRDKLKSRPKRRRLRTSSRRRRRRSGRRVRFQEQQISMTGQKKAKKVTSIQDLGQFHRALKAELGRLLELVKAERLDDSSHHHRRRRRRNVHVKVSKRGGGGGGKITSIVPQKTAGQKAVLKRQADQLHAATKAMKRKAQTKMANLKGMVKQMKKKVKKAKKAEKAKRRRRRQTRRRRTRRRSRRQRRAPSSASSSSSALPSTSSAKFVLGKLRSEMEARQRLAKARIASVEHEQKSVATAARTIEVAHKVLDEDRNAYRRQLKVLAAHAQAKALAKQLKANPSSKHITLGIHNKVNKLVQKARAGTQKVVQAEKRVAGLLKKETESEHEMYRGVAKSIQLKKKVQHAERVDAAVQQMLATYGEEELAKKLQVIIAHPQSTKQQEHARAMLLKLRHGVLQSTTTTKRNEALAKLLHTLDEQQKAHEEQLRAIHKQREALSAAKLTNNLQLLANSEHGNSLSEKTLLAQARVAATVARTKEAEAQMVSRMAMARQHNAYSIANTADKQASHVEHLHKVLKKFESMKPCCAKGESPSSKCARGPNCLCTTNAKPQGCIEDMKLQCPGPNCGKNKKGKKKKEKKSL